jgi:hypothetical protein
MYPRPAVYNKDKLDCVKRQIGTRYCRSRKKCLDRYINLLLQKKKLFLYFPVNANPTLSDRIYLRVFGQKSLASHWSGQESHASRWLVELDNFKPVRTPYGTIHFDHKPT